MGRLFGTDGVRGIANHELTPELAYNLGRAGAYVLSADVKHAPKILVGRDTRISGEMLESALVAGICSVGATCICVGVLPTPAIAYLTRLYGADAGVVISASHNPYEFNGIKFFNGDGYKLPDETEEKIESIILDGSEELPRPTGKQIGVKITKESAIDDYISFLKKSISCDLKGLKIAVDCSNGAAYKVAPRVFAELGADVKVINNEPDGININFECGSTHINGLKKFVVESGADLGIAFDGDADRALAVDEKGNLVDGDQIMSILALEFRKNGKLKDNTLVVTVMSNMGLHIMAKREGLNVVKTKVGDRYVLEEMLNKGYSIGGEQSGHIILLDLNTTGDGLLTAIKLLEVVKTSGKKLSELASVMQVLPQVLVNARVSNENKHKYMEDEEISRMCKELEEEFNGEGRVLIRPSGTEPLVRVMIEGKDQEYIAKRAKELAELIEQRLSKAN